jgi:hypothetical protein
MVTPYQFDADFCDIDNTTTTTANREDSLYVSNNKSANSELHYVKQAVWQQPT